MCAQQESQHDALKCLSEIASAILAFHIVLMGKQAISMVQGPDCVHSILLKLAMMAKGGPTCWRK